MLSSRYSRAGRAVRIVAIAYAFAASGAGAVAAEQPASSTSDTFAAATARFEAGEYGAALELFEAVRAAGGDAPALHYNIGVCQYRLGEYETAAATFRQLGERFAELRAVADYNVGLAELGAGRHAAAEAAFARAAAGDDPTVAELGARMLEQGTAERAARAAEAPARKPAWTRHVELQAGHDDNVVLLEESSLPAGQSSSSPFAALLAVASGEPFARVPVALDFGGYLIRYPDASGYDQEALRIGARYLLDAGRWRIEAGPHYDRTRLDGAGFEEQLGAGVSMRRPLSAAVELEIRLQHDRFEALRPEYDYVRGDRNRLRLGLAHNVAHGRVSARYELERNDRQSPAVSADRDRFALDYEHYLPGNWSVETGVVVRASRYELRAREEDLLELNLAALKQLQAGWLVRAELGWADNDATVESLAYERTRLGVGIAKLF